MNFGENRESEKMVGMNGDTGEGSYIYSGRGSLTNKQLRITLSDRPAAY